MLLRSGLTLAPLAPASSLASLAAAPGPCESHSTLLSTTKNEVLQKDSTLATPELTKWNRLKCLVRVAGNFALCRRMAWLPFTIESVARRLKTNDELRVQWCYRVSPSKKYDWEGVVQSASPTTVLYKKHRAPLPFPPADNVKVTGISVKEAPLQQLFRTHLVQGEYVHLLLSSKEKWTGIVTSSTPTLVRWFNLGLTLPWPPPNDVKVVNVRHVRQAPMPQPQESTRSERKRLQRMKVDVGNPTPGPGFPVVNELAPISTGRAKAQLVVGSLNVRSMTDRTKVDALICIAQQRNLGMLALQETRRTKDSPQISTGAWVLLESFATPQGNAGVAILIDSNYAPQVMKTHEIVPSRILAIELAELVVYTVYLPTFIDLETRESCLHELSKVDATIANRKIRIYLGDFNARPLSQVTQRTRAASQQFDDWLTEHNLTTQLRFVKPRATTITFAPTTKHTSRNWTLDYAVLRFANRRIMTTPHSKVITRSSRST